MNPDNDLQLDRDRHQRLQEIAATLQALLDEENRPDEERVKIRHDLLEAAECFWSALNRYRTLIAREE